MKFKAMIITVLLLALSICAFAQDAGNGNAAAGNRPARQGRQSFDRIGPAVKDLGLSEAQIQKIRDAVTQFRKDSMEARQGTGTDAEKQAKADAAKATATTAIKAVLTEAKVDAAKQDEVVKALLDRRGRPSDLGTPRTPGNNPPAAGGNPPAGAQNRRGGNMRMGFLDQLNLTEEQKTKVDELTKAFQEKMKAINDDTTLTPETRRQKMQELRKKLMDDIKALLTDEQKTKFEELTKPRTRPAAPQS